MVDPQVDPSTVRDHHVKLEYCYTRPRYREGRLERSVKVVVSCVLDAWCQRTRFDPSYCRFIQ